MKFLQLILLFTCRYLAIARHAIEHAHRQNKRDRELSVADKNSDANLGFFIADLSIPCSFHLMTTYSGRSLPIGVPDITVMKK